MKHAGKTCGDLWCQLTILEAVSDNFLCREEAGALQKHYELYRVYITRSIMYLEF